ncbi:MarR family transcriptional regulator [Dehalogenimonas sp. THU2]|uniref:MarR family winged helix-turn-helix transcriptional regulator n=1 Tax=Dehalogenimonas sp. THU2 TaxID=3151121 RepID=UPI003218332E
MTNRIQQIEHLMGKLHSLKRLMAPESHTACGEECLAPSQWLALHLISRQEGIGIKELASLLGITSSAATQLVDILVKRGLLIREPSPDDRRALCLVVPEEARRQIESIKDQRLERMESVFSALDDAEFQMLMNLIDKVISGSQIEKTR